MKLTKLEKKWALAIYEIIFPVNKNPNLSLGAKDVPLANFLDDFFSNTPFITSIGIRLTLISMQFLPFLFIKKTKIFKNLTLAEKEEYLNAWSNNKIYLIRQMATFVKMVGTLGFCGFENVQKQLGVEVEKQKAPFKKDI